MSILGSPAGVYFRGVAEVGQAFPTLPIMIEHLGGIGWSDAPPYPIFRRILALAQYPNCSPSDIRPVQISVR